MPRSQELAAATKTHKRKGMDSPLEPLGRVVPAIPRLWPSETDSGLPSSRIAREYVCCLKPQACGNGYSSHRKLAQISGHPCVPPA